MWKGTAPTLKAIATSTRSIARTEIFAFDAARASIASLAPSGAAARRLCAMPGKSVWPVTT